MFGKVAGFEFRYQIRQPVFWVGVIIFFLLPFAAMTIEQVRIGGGGGNIHKNAPYAVAQILLVLNLFYMFITTAFVANVVVRDDETGFGPLIRTTQVSKADYLFGRFTGAFLAAALGYLAAPLGILIGSMMPWVDAETMGPNRLMDYAYAYTALALPGVFMTSAIFFSVATITRSMMWTYVGVIALLIIWTVTTGVLGTKPELETALAYGEPFGFGAFGLATKYWTGAERNAFIPAFEGVLMANRLLWVAISALVLFAAYSTYRFGSKGAKLRKHQKLQALADRQPAVQPLAMSSLARPKFDGATAHAQLWARTEFEMGQVFKSPAYFVLLALGLFNSIGALWFAGEVFGTETLPVTRMVIQTLQGSFSIIPLIIAIYYAGELVWRERERKTHELIDSTAAPDWAFVFPKTFALTLVLVSTLLISVVAGVATQALKGYMNFELGKYLVWYVLPQAIDWTMLAVLAVFLQAIAPHKFVGWGLMLIYLIANLTLSNLGLENYLYHYGATIGEPLSDMNGMGDYWKGAYWYRVYWSAFAVLLTILSYGLWRRGTESRLKPRINRMPARLRGPAGVIGALAILTFVGAGAYIFLNTSVWNEYRTNLDDEKRTADYEKTFIKVGLPKPKKGDVKAQKAYDAAYLKAVETLERAPRPTITDVKLNLDLRPHAPRLATHGEYVMENRTGVPIETLLVQAPDNLKVVKLNVPGAKVETDYKRFNARMYRFAAPLQPGQKLTVSFDSVLEQRGFKNRGNTTRLVDNGTFVNNGEFSPSIGFSRGGLLQDRAKRRKYGLPPELRPAKLEDEAARAHNYVGGADWVNADITVTTDADQTPIAPGYKVSDVTAHGRRTARFTTEAPILNFLSVQSAHYVEKHRMYKGVDLVVYYDAQHPYNVDRMLDALQSGLDYYQANFSPYQFRQVRVIEFPDYAQFAQSFANTIPWSEGLGFIADVHDKDKIDYVTYIAAHELGHQWWAHQVISADSQGGTVLVETLAQYSALMVMEKKYGPDKIRQFLKFELDRYLRSRGGEIIEELPLERVENQQYIHYRKGSLVMYLLKDQLGEDVVNRALRRVLAQYAFKGAPYPRSLDLVEALRAEAPADKQQLITDLFEKITLYDVKVTSLTSKKRADGQFDVRMTVSARKVYADGRGKETETPMAGESFDIGLFTAEPGRKNFDAKNVILFERRPLKTGTQTFDFVTRTAPKFGGADPYNKWIDRNSDDNVKPVG